MWMHVTNDLQSRNVRKEERFELTPFIVRAFLSLCVHLFACYSVHFSLPLSLSLLAVVFLDHIIYLHLNIWTNKTDDLHKQIDINL